MRDGVTRYGNRWLLCLVGPSLWFLHFSLLYALTSWGAVTGLSASGIAAAAWGLTAAAAAGLVVCWGVLQRVPVATDRADTGVRQVAGLLALLSLAGVVLQAQVLALL